jgi:hypothetical protein
VALVVVSSLSGRAAAETFHIDPMAGADDAGHDGSEVRPFKSLSFALSRRAGAELHLRLRPGVYEGSDIFGLEEGHQELFPLTQEPGLRSLRVSGPPPEAGEAVIRPLDPELSAFYIETAASSLVAVFERLRFEGGFSAVSLHAPERTGLDVTIASCVFTAQEAAGVQFYAGRGDSKARSSLRVESCRFEGPGAGVVLEGMGGEEESRVPVELVISASSFSDSVAVGPDGLLGAAVELHVGAGAWIDARLFRCEFRDTASVLALSSSPAGRPGRVSAILGSSLIYSSAGPCSDLWGGEACGVRQVLSLALWPHHAAGIRLINNTFWALQRHAVFRWNRDELPEGIELPLLLANNVFWGGGAALLGGPEPRDEQLPPGMALERNILPASWGAAAGDDNLISDPRFEDPEAGDFRLRAGSPAIDAGDPHHTLELPEIDLAGGCRRAAAGEPPRQGLHPVDLGAYEHPGECESRKVLAFIRGDCNLNGRPEMADAISIFGYLFLNSATPACLDACDANDSGTVDITDGIYILLHLFLGGGPPPSPFPQPGYDPTKDALPVCFR